MTWRPVRWVLVLAGSALLLAGCAASSTTSSAGQRPAAAGSATSGSTAGRAAGASTALSSGAVLTMPTLIARTAAGTVAYRKIGAGSPIVAIMGLSGSMDDWAPAFLAGLAAEHTVVVFDNAGIGQTAALSSPLSITAMAGQASALISTLGVGPATVLGWSMGGMIAQALAVLHPAQVSRLILAATQPGTGRALPIPAAAAAALASPNPGAALSVLFPPGQAAAARAYGVAILAYPGFYQAPAAVTAAQGVAVRQWLAGADPAGRQLGQLRLPTLVADGTEDALNPVANDHQLADGVPGARLILYPGAGHAFLFQDTASFVPAVQKFLG